MSIRTAPGLPALVDRMARKLRAENGIDVAGGSRIMVTAGANMAFMHAVLAITEPGDEIILPVPFYFNHEMAIQMAGCRAVARADRRSLPAATRRDPGGDHRSHARHRDHLAEQPERRGPLRDVAARGQRALPRSRAVPHRRRGRTSTSPTDRRGMCRRARLPGAGAHTISIYSLSKAYGFAGWRIGYMALPRAPGVRDDEEPGHDPDLPDRSISQVAALAALEVGRAVLRAARSRARRTSGTSCSDSCRGLGPLAQVPAGRRRVLLPAERATRTWMPLVLAERLIREHKVAVIPGPAFGMTSGCYFRVAYGALQKETVAEGIGRLVDRPARDSAS